MEDNQEFLKSSSERFGMFEGGVNYSLRSNESAIANMVIDFEEKQKEFNEISYLLNGGLAYILSQKHAGLYDSGRVDPKIFAGEFYSVEELDGIKKFRLVPERPAKPLKTVNVKLLTRLDVKKLETNYMVRLIALKESLLGFPARLDSMCNNLDRNYRVNNNEQEVASVKKYAQKTREKIQQKLNFMDFSKVPTLDEVVAKNMEINRELQAFSGKQFMIIK